MWTIRVVGAGRMGQPWILSWGLGADSTAILLRWLVEPSSREFALEDLVVVAAMTGDEFAETIELCERHVLPRLRDAGARLVQVARGGRSVGDGVVVLDDSRHPTRLYGGGAYKLSDELLSAGTVPMVASGRRTCTAKAKGVPLDSMIEQLSRGAAFTHVLGFECDEQGRAARDRSYSSVARANRYPLIEWGWDRAACQAYLESVTGVVSWPKSCCVYCPFSANRGNLATHLARYAREPDAALLALRIERASRALNASMTLYGSKSVEDLLVAGGLGRLVDELDARLATEEHVVMDVRRVLVAKGRGWRSTRVVFRGSRDSCAAELRRLAAEVGSEIETDAEAVRLWLRRRGDDGVSAERFFVVVPGRVEPKQRPGFERVWSRAVGDGRLFAVAV